MQTEILLSFDKPPLNMNDRQHWRARAAKTKAIRSEVHIRAKASTIPLGLSHITAEFHYRPRDNRRRDADNLTATAKACFDGLVDAGVVPDDVPAHMTKLMPVIHPAIPGERAACWLRVEWAQTPAVTR